MYETIDAESAVRKAVVTILWESLSRKERVMVVIIIVLSMFMLYFGYTYVTGKNESPVVMDGGLMNETKADKKVEVDNDGHDKPQPAQAEILMVDVKGAVRSPGVYQISNGKRVNDVILMAGGFTDEADPNGINLAKVLVDEMVVYVPKIGEAGTAPVVSQQAEEGGKININEADSTKLQEIPGIGPTKAGAIIQYREENGSFKSIDDLLNVPGIGEKTLEQMKAEITI